MSISFKDVSFIYSKDMPYAHTALKHVDLELDAGKVIAIVGKTGSGKSTLIQHLNALLVPNGGEIKIFDHSIIAGVKSKNLKKLRQKVGLVFQFSEYQLFEETILKDVAFGPKNFGSSESEAIEKAKKALSLVGIEASMYERNPLDLSGGQKRRVAIAGILAIDPDVIVLDEPTAGLDPRGSKEMIALFDMLNKKLNKTIIIVTHDNEIVYEFADEVVMLSDGKIVMHTNTDEFFSDENIDKYDIVMPKVINTRRSLEKRGIHFRKVPHSLDELAKLLKEMCHE